MKKIGIIVTALAVLALPVGAAAKPTKADKRHAAKECRAERDAMGVENFVALYGNFGKCVSQNAREEAAERKAAREGKQDKAEADAEDQAELNAAKTCRAEQEAIGEEAFAEKYGTNKNKRNAFGKCVSGISKEQGEDETDGEEPEVEEPEAEEPETEGTV